MSPILWQKQGGKRVTIPDIDVAGMIKNAHEEALKARGQANILIVGKTGSGKSTLINTVFQGRMAETGQGKPITQGMKKITKGGIPVSIYDSKGLEVKDYKPILAEMMKFIETTNRNVDSKEHIHAAWICIAEGSRRVEDAEIELAQALSEKGIPVVIVITTAISDQGFKSEVETHFPTAVNTVRVNSIEFLDDEGRTNPVKGVAQLVELTMEVIPEGQKNAFASAQRIKIEHKVDRARLIVAGAAATAGTAGAAPIPFSDAFAIVPIQIGMLASIAAVFGIDVSMTFLSTLVSGTFTSLAGSIGGRALVGAFLKMFPGAGSIAGGAVSAGVAMALTTAFGEAYITVLKRLIGDNPDKTPTASEIAEALKEQMKSVSVTAMFSKS